MAKELFGVFAPILGEKRDFPTILLDKTIQVDNSNIVRKYGEVRRRKMRKPDMIGAQVNELDTDTNWGAVLGTLTVDTADKYSGTGSLKFVTDAGSSTALIYYNPSHPWDLSDTTLLKMYMKGDTAESGVLILYDIYGNSRRWDFTYVTSWTEMSFDFTNADVESGDMTWEKMASLYIYLVGGNKTARFDYMSVRDKSQTPDANPILHYHRFVKRSTTTEYILAFTKAHIYLWNSTDETWDTKFVCQSDCTEWDTISYNDKVIATNNVDMVLEWDTTGYFMPLQNTSATNITAATKANPCQITAATHGLTTGDRVFIKNVVGMTEINNLQFVVTVIDVDTFTLDDINSSAYTTYTSGGTVVEFQGINYTGAEYLTKAKYVTTFENYLILGYTYENAVSKPQRIRWSDIGDETDWSSGDAGSKETEGEDFVVGFKIYSGQLIIFKELSMIRQWLIATSDVWNWVVLPGNIGCLSNHSIVEDPDGRVYWLASDMAFREIEAGEISQAIDPIVKLIEPSSDYLVYGKYIAETGEIWWAIPYDNALNNKVLTYKNGDWGELDMSVPALGDYHEA